MKNCCTRYIFARASNRFLSVSSSFAAVLNSLLLLLFFIFTGATLFQILVWGTGFSSLACAKGRIPWLLSHKRQLPAVSVVVCARNEAQHLRKHLPLLAAQEYEGEFEIIVVNDASSDETAQVLKNQQSCCARLRTVHLPRKTGPGKKAALQEGIAAARFDWLLLTDADCAPASNRWIAGMMAVAGTPSAEIVAGYAPCRAEDRAFFRYEVAFTALQYGAFALWHFPYMATGRNMAWRKALFARHRGFTAHSDLASGDDDLFVNTAATAGNLRLCLHSATFMRSAAPPDLTAWWRQKRRHLSAAPRYRTAHRLLLGAIALTHTLHYGLGAILLAAAPAHSAYILALYALRMAIAWPVALAALRRLGERDLAVFFPWWDGWMAVWYGAGVPFLLWGRQPVAWK